MTRNPLKALEGLKWEFDLAEKQYGGQVHNLTARASINATDPIKRTVRAFVQLSTGKVKYNVQLFLDSFATIDNGNGVAYIDMQSLRQGITEMFIREANANGHTGICKRR